MNNLTRYLDLGCAVTAALLSLGNFTMRRGEGGWQRVGKWVYLALTVIFGMHAAALYLGYQGPVYRLSIDLLRQPVIVWTIIEVFILIDGRKERPTAGADYSRGRWDDQGLVSHRRLDTRRE